jgi:hypothetical protein
MNPELLALSNALTQGGLGAGAAQALVAYLASLRAELDAAKGQPRK